MAKGNKKEWKSKRSLWLTRLAFLALSCFLWLLLELGSNRYTTTLEVPIHLVDLPRDEMVLKAPDVLRIKSKAAAIYSITGALKDRELISIPFSYLEREADNVYFLTTEGFTDAAAGDIPAYAEWQIMGDTVWITTSSLERKKVPLIPNHNLTYKEPYYAFGKPVLNPDSLFVFGPAELLDTLKSVRLPEYKETNVEEDVEYTWDVVLPERLLSSTRTVEVHQPIAQFTEKWIDVQLDVPATANWIAQPSMVSVRCRVPLSSYGGIRPKMFNATVTKRADGDAEAAIEWLKIPDDVELIDWTPRYVEIVQKR